MFQGNVFLLPKNRGFLSRSLRTSSLGELFMRNSCEAPRKFSETGLTFGPSLGWLDLKGDEGKVTVTHGGEST